MTKSIKPKNVIILSDPANARFLPNKVTIGFVANGHNTKMTSC